jgi:hypothetical protein
LTRYHSPVGDSTNEPAYTKRYQHGLHYFLLYDAAKPDQVPHIPGQAFLSCATTASRTFVPRGRSKRSTLYVIGELDNPSFVHYPVYVHLLRKAIFG